MSRFFNGLPASGVLTDGNDTLRAAQPIGEVDALGGDDLLIASYNLINFPIRVEIIGTTTEITILGPDDATFLGHGFTRHQITLGTGDDYIEATLGNATIRGGLGDDTFILGGGNNQMFGGDGNDAFVGVTLTDRIDGGRGLNVAQIDLRGSGLDGVTLGGRFTPLKWVNVQIFVGHLTSGDDIVLGGARFIPNNHPIEFAFDTTLSAGEGDDLLVLDYTSIDHLAIGSGQFQIGTVASIGSFPLLGSGWTGLMRGFERFDITGTRGSDEFLVVDGTSTLRGGNGDDLFEIESGFHTIHGGGGNDEFVVRGGAALKLIGGGGDDRFTDVRRSDTVQGGVGRDTVIVDLTAQGEPAIWLDFTNLGRNTNWSSLERIEGRLTAFNDTLQGAGLQGVVDGGDGIDLLRLKFHDRAFTSVRFDPMGELLTVANEAFLSGPGGATAQSTFSGFEIFDLAGTIGHDVLGGGALNDTLKGERGNDTMAGWAGHDKLDGGGGDDVLFGGVGNDTLLGAHGSDTLHGNEGNDLLEGGTSNDLLYGGAGNDRLGGGRGHDTLYGEDGNDVVFAANGNDLMFGGAGSDTLYGSSGHDTLIAGPGRDELFGGSGNDLLVAGGTGDLLSGGIGADRFHFRADFAGQATVVDFNRRFDLLSFDDSLTRADLSLNAQAGGVLVSWAGASVLLEGVRPDQLSDTNFLFETLTLPDF